MEQPFNILDLPKEILVQIISLLDHRQIVELSTVSLRFHELCSMPVVWKKVHFPITIESKHLKASLDFLSPSTRTLFISFQRFRTLRVVDSLLKKMLKKCPNLKELYLHDTILTAKKKTYVDMLPSGLTVLSLVNSEIYPGLGFFKKVHLHLKQLKKIDLTNTLCFISEDSRNLLKCTNLEEIIMQQRPGFFHSISAPNMHSKRRETHSSLKVLDFTMNVRSLDPWLMPTDFPNLQELRIGNSNEPEDNEVEFFLRKWSSLLLASCQSLQLVAIQNAMITSKVIEFLVGLKNLKKLELISCRSDEDQTPLKQLLPKCEIKVEPDLA